MEDLISIIVAMYNKEKVLLNCLESIRRQSCPNFEVLIVGDGFTDSNLSIANIFSEKDNRFKVYTNYNLEETNFSKGYEYAVLP